MKSFKLLFISSLFLAQIFFSHTCFAEQKIQQGEYQVHYSVFPSNIISHDVAALYKIKRSGYRAVVNITPQKLLADGSAIGVKAAVSGKARNLIGNTKVLEFREIIEGDAVYYIAEFSFSNEETFRFDISVLPEGEQSQNIQINLSQKFYTE